MPVRFDTSADRLIRTASVIDYNAAYTVAFWVYFPSFLSAYGDLFAISDGTPSNYDVLSINPSNVPFVESAPFGGTNFGSGPSATTWYWAVLRRESASSLTGRLYDATGSIVASANYGGNVSGRAASSRMEFNGNASEGEWTQMRVAHVKAWSTNLTDTELLQEQNAIRPQKLDNLVGWWPLFPGSGERVKDYSGLGRDWTEGGTLTDEDPPPISYGGKPLFYPFITSVGGTTYTQSIAGAMTPTGTLLKQDNKVVSGALTFVGTLTKQPRKVLAGGVTPSATVIKQTAKPLVGSVTPSGTLVKQSNKLLTAALASAGTLARQTNKVLSGAITPAATLIKQVNKLLAGGITPSGTLTRVKVALLTLTASLTPSGTLVKKTNKALSGAITSIAGSLTKQVNKTLAGGITPSGTLARVKVALLSITGSMTPSGTLVRKTNKPLSGAITSIAGTLTKQANRTFAGGITPSGTLARVKVALLTLTASLTPSGTLVKRANKSLAATLTPSATLTKRIAKSAFTAALSLAGTLSAFGSGAVALLPLAGTILDALVYGAQLADMSNYASSIGDEANFTGSTTINPDH